jgi:hypothetical protein
MAASLQPKSQQTEQSTWDPPIIPEVLEMHTWDGEKLLQWIQQRSPTLLQDDDLKKFQKAKINGTILLGMTREELKECGLSITVSAGLKYLADEVKEGKFIAWT